MSVRTLTEVETKQEQWSGLYCFSLESNNIFASNANILNITGALFTENGVLVPANYAFTTGTGTIANPQNTVSRWRANNTSRQYRSISDAFLVSNFTGPFTAPGSRMAIDITIPYGESMSYPTSIGNPIPGSSVAGYVDNGGGVRFLVSGFIVRNSATVITLNISVGGDVSVLVPGRNMTIAYSLTYQVA